MLASFSSAIFFLVCLFPTSLWARLPPLGASPSILDFVYEAKHSTPLNKLMTLVSISYPRMYTDDEKTAVRILEAAYSTNCSLSSFPDGSNAIICAPDVSQLKFFRINCTISQDPANHTWIPKDCQNFPVDPATLK